MTLPVGFTVELDRDARILDDGEAIAGGSPTRVLFLKPAARGLIAGRRLVVRDAPTAVLADRLVETGIAHPVLDALPALDAMTDDDVTVVIPVRDRPRELARLLGSLGGAFRTIVVDDASDDPAAIRAVAREHGAEPILLPRNLGPGGARNAGLARARTAAVLFADSDIVLAPDDVRAMRAHLVDPRTAMVAPRITGLGTASSGSWVGRYEQARSSLDLGMRAGPVRPRSAISWASTACVIARRDALGDGFDEALRVGEDVDLGWRLVDAGWRVRYEPRVAVAHEHRTRSGDWLLRKAVYGTGAAPLAERHPEHIAPAVLAPWSAGVVAALLAQRWWSLPVAGLLAARTVHRVAGRLERTRHPVRLAALLTGNGVLAALAQASALLLRHWWPIAAIACIVSRRMRRAVLLAAVVDVAVEYRRTDARLDPVRFGVARRLDDLAYGAGVWWSAIRSRSGAALRPDLRRQT